MCVEREIERYILCALQRDSVCVCMCVYVCVCMGACVCVCKRETDKLKERWIETDEYMTKWLPIKSTSNSEKHTWSKKRF